MTRRKRNYELSAKPADRTFPAPRLPYEPPQPRHYSPRIGLIGCGGITASHLRAYRAAHWNVVALCDRNPAAAELRQREFYPQARIYRDYRELLARPDVDVVDIALHPEPRAAVIAAALNAGKHVLSQKPFVLDLDVGKQLVALARKQKRQLAVNQNGRWAPYFSYLYQAVRAGCIGDVQTVSMQLNWDHTWIKNTPFEKMPHVLLYDFAIHWFDLTAQFFQDRKARAVFAFNTRAPGQSVKPPLLGGATVAFAKGMATLHFDAHSRFDSRECIGITGTTGTLRAEGAICAAHEVTLTNRRGIARPELTGKWFDDGFRGAMGELLCAIETGQTPANAAETVLPGLALGFAAVQSAHCGEAVAPGAARKLCTEPPRRR